MFSQGFTASNVSSKQVRDGLMSVLEYRPNKTFRTAVDLYYSKFTQDRVPSVADGDLGLWSDPGVGVHQDRRKHRGNGQLATAARLTHSNIIDDKNFNRTDDIPRRRLEERAQARRQVDRPCRLGFSKAKRHERLIESIATGLRAAAPCSCSPAWQRRIPAGRPTRT